MVKKLYIELANKELSNIDMYNQMNKNNSKVKESSNNAIEKYKIDDII